MKNRNTGPRKVFLGGNTSRGFYSFYDQVVNPVEANRIFVLKGGPGMGKSTFMRKIGEAMSAQGYHIEYCCCSSDNDSLDGVHIPEIGIVLLDGTAPHIVDPKNPGAVDEIINLGEYWNEKGLRPSKEAIIELNREIKGLFQRAYGYLAQARILKDEVESYYTESRALDITGLNALARGLERLVLNNARTYLSPGERHIFASGITPNGTVNYLESIFAPLKQRYILRGPAGSGKATIVGKLYNAAVSKGVTVEAFHCSLRPEEIEHLVFPDLKIGVITGSPPHLFRAVPGDIILDTNEFVHSSKLEPFKEDMAEADKRYVEALDRAVSFISRAKSKHDELEAHYIPNMDFDGVNKCREKILKRILDYAGE